MMTESFAELFEESLAHTELRAGRVVTGTVVKITPEVVIVHAGLKSEGVIPRSEFTNKDGELEVEIGSQVEVALDAVEDGYGETRLSREKARRNRTWDLLDRAFAAGDLINGRITGKVKGGFTVEVGDIHAFLPGSLVDVRPVRDVGYLEGKDLEFKVIKLDRRRNNVVVSRRAVVESEHSAERQALMENLEAGQTVRGVVKNLTEYGAFVDLGGIDGLLHITDMAWKRVKHPSEVVQVGAEIEVKVLKFDKERNRVSLGLKQTGEDPWRDLARRYPEGKRLFGRITNVTEYGCFVEIEDGIEGLVHVSEMDWTNKNVNPVKAVHVGQEVEVAVLDVDEERRRISLGIKQCQPNPWEEFSANFKKGDRIKGVIKSITDFGVFVGLDGGIDGLVHLSDISWNTPGEEAIRNYQKGQDLEAVVLQIDPQRERISLGIKQMDADPFSAFIGTHEKGAIVKGRVKSVDAKVAIVDLGEGVEGFLRASELSRDRVADARTVLSEGDEVEAKFIGVDKKNHAITLSIKAKDVQEDEQALAGFGRSTGATPTLGDLFKEQMDERR